LFQFAGNLNFKKNVGKPGDFFSLIGAISIARAYQHPRRNNNEYTVAGEKKLYKLFFFKARFLFKI
jgi:hypothetical protein